MAINKVFEIRNKYYKICGVTDVKNNNLKRENGLNVYILKMANTNKEGTETYNENEIKIKTNYQFFFDEDDDLLWGFEPMTHIHCYLDDSPVNIKIIGNKTLIREEEFEKYLEKYLMRLEKEENSKYLKEIEEINKQLLKYS